MSCFVTDDSVSEASRMFYPIEKQPCLLFAHGVHFFLLSEDMGAYGATKTSILFLFAPYFKTKVE